MGSVEQKLDTTHAAEAIRALHAQWIKERDDAIRAREKADKIIEQRNFALRDLERQLKKLGSPSDSEEAATKEATSISAMVDDTLEEFKSGEPFSSRDIWSGVLAIYNDAEDSPSFRANVTSILSQLVLAGKLVVVEKGAGTRPTTYRFNVADAGAQGGIAASA